MIDRDAMHTDLVDLREARTPWWQRAWAAIRAWWAEAHKPVPMDQCPACPAKDAQNADLLQRLDAESAKVLRLEQKLAAIMERESQGGMVHEVTEASASARLPVDAIPSSVKASDSRREGYAIARLTPYSGSFTVPPGTPVLGGEEEGGVSVAGLWPRDLETEKRALSAATRQTTALGMAQRRSIATRALANRAPTNAEVLGLTNAQLMARVRGEA